MKKRDLLIPLVLLAVGASVGFLFRDRQAATANARSEGATDLAAAGVFGDSGEAITIAGDQASPAQARPTRTTDNSAAVPKPVIAALPPLDAPVAAIYESLLERAKRGDGPAACRLAAELQLCADRDFMLEGADRAARMLDERGEQAATPGREPSQWESRRLSMAQQQIDFALALDERCKGVTQVQLDAHVDLWRQAARTGHVPSMVHYAQGDGFRMRNTLDNLEQLQTYKSEAERMMRAAAAAGSVEAAQHLSAAYAENRSPWSGLFQQAVKPNPVEAYALHLLAKQRGYPSISRIMMPGRWNRTMDSKENGEYGYSVDEPEMAAAGQLAAKYNLEWQPAEHLPVDQDEAREPWSREQRTRESCARNQFTPLQ